VNPICMTHQTAEPVFIRPSRNLKPFRSSLLVRGSAMLAASAAFTFGASAQNAETTLPDAPSVTLAALQQDDNARQVEKQTTPTQNTPNGPVNPADGGHPKQTKRILGIVPNFRAVSADTKLPPQTVKEKFISTSQQSFDYSSVLFSAILAGVAQAQDSTPQFHQGAAGYGRYFWHTFADQTDENFMVQAIIPAATHEDSRYYTLGHGNLAHRALYAFDRTLITRTDAGGETFNFSEIVGAGAASGISTTYYPSAERTWTKTGQRWLQNVIIDGATYMFQEFWPDINNAVFHQQ
jgi:hypothetical protein